MAIAGLRGTGDWGTDERPKNFREMILWRDPNGEAPLTALSSKMKKEKTNDPEFSWWEEDLAPVRLQVTAAAIAAATTTINFITGSDAQLLVAKDLLMVEVAETTGAFPNEIVMVSTIVSATQITVVRGQAGSTADTIGTSAFMTRIGSAFEEGSGAPAAASKNPTKYTNYTQIFKTAYNLSGSALETNARTGDPLKNDKKRRMFDHAVGIEQAAFFGRPYETTLNGEQIRFSGGFLNFIKQAYDAGFTHVHKVFTAAVTENTLLDAIYKIWDYNANGAGNERLTFCGNGALNALNKIALASSSSRINFEGTVKMYGMELHKWVFPQGTLYLRTHPIMNRNTLYTNSICVLNPAGIRYRPLGGRDTKMQDNIQANDADQKKGQWITEAGFEWNHMPTMCYLGNVTAA